MTQELGHVHSDQLIDTLLLDDELTSLKHRSQIDAIDTLRATIAGIETLPADVCVFLAPVNLFIDRAPFLAKFSGFEVEENTNTGLMKLEWQGVSWFSTKPDVSSNKTRVILP